MSIKIASRPLQGICGRELCEWPWRGVTGERAQAAEADSDLHSHATSAEAEPCPRMTIWEGIVPQLTALSLSIAVLGAVWAYLA